MIQIIARRMADLGRVPRCLVSLRASSSSRLTSNPASLVTVEPFSPRSSCPCVHSSQEKEAVFFCRCVLGVFVNFAMADDSSCRSPPAARTPLASRGSRRLRCPLDCQSFVKYLKEKHPPGSAGLRESLPIESGTLSIKKTRTPTVAGATKSDRPVPLCLH